MKLNWVETLVMNNPVRSRVQRRREAPGLARLAPRPTMGARCLVIGCGRGVDVELAFDFFGAARVTAIDLDERQVARARSRLGARYGERLRLEQGDATRLAIEDESIELVLDFGIIHHIPRWQDAIAEVARVLAPGGQFLFEEIPASELETRLYRWLTDHPRENRFGPEEFGQECERRGLAVGTRLERFRILVFKAFRGAAVKA